MAPLQKFRKRVKLVEKEWAFTNWICSTGYDQIPVESMQGLEIGGNDSTYGPMDAMDVAHEGDLSFDNLSELPSEQTQSQDQGSVPAAWYDTDL